MTDILNEKKFKQIKYLNQDKDSNIKIEINKEIGKDKVEIRIQTVRESNHGGQRCCIVHYIDADVYEIFRALETLGGFINE